MVTKTRAVANVASDDVLAALSEGYKQEESTQGIRLPRFGLVSSDVTEEVKNPKTGKKEIKILTEAGIFYIERETDEEEEIVDGKGKVIGTKKKWERTEIGTEAEIIIFFKRYQLAEYDQQTKLYTSSPVYDNDDEVLPLFCDGNEIDRGTPADLKKKYMYEDKKGKQRCSLEVRRVLYILYEGEVYQWTLRGSSLWSLSDYEKKVLSPTVLTHVSSTAEENGDVSWNKAKFTVLRKVNQEEGEQVVALKDEMNKAIERIKAGYSESDSEEDDEDEEEAETPAARIDKKNKKSF